MPWSASQNRRGSRDKNIRQPAPLLLVAINDEGHLGIFFNVTNALETVWCHPFRLFIDSRKELFTVKGKADRNDVRLAFLIGGGKVGRTGRADEREMFIGERHLEQAYWSNGVWGSEDALLHCSSTPSIPCLQLELSHGVGRKYLFYLK